MVLCAVVFTWISLSYPEYRQELKQVPDESGEFYEAIGMYQNPNALSLAVIFREALRELPQVRIVGIHPP
jgi:hypothetical protein